MSDPWPQERRKKQAENIRQTQPWRHSTGPTTDTGKAKVGQNGTKHGLRGGVFRKMEELLALHNKILKELENGHCKN